MIEGIISQINVKPQTEKERGLPKIEVPKIRVLETGLKGDYNKYRTEGRNGDLDQAVLIMPWEMIEEIKRNHWYLEPGWLGENFTTEGIFYEHLAQRQIYRLGDSVEVELTKPAKPCGNLKLLSQDIKNKWPEFKEYMEDKRGWYAKVLREGIVKKGDKIILLK